MQNSITSNFWLKATAVGVLSVLVFACKKDEPEISTSAMPTGEMSAKQPNEAKLEQDRLTRRSSSELCPRLIQKRVDNSQVVRQESITGNICDYYIYPNVGDVVTVKVSDSRMKPFLRLPYVFDFSNGAYKVVQAGRHVIRLEYNSFDVKPDVMNYVIEVDVKSAQ